MGLTDNLYGAATRIAGGPPEAMVYLLELVVRSRAGTHDASMSYADEQQQRLELDPGQRFQPEPGPYGIQGILSETEFVLARRTASGSRADDLEVIERWPRSGVALQHRRVGLPGLRSRQFVIAFPDGRYFIGSSPMTLGARSRINDPDALVAAFGPGATELPDGIFS